MDNDSRRRAVKTMVTALVVAAMYFFVAEKIRKPVQVDGGQRVIMGTFARVVSVTKHQWQGRRCNEAGFNELNRMDAMMSDYKADSELSKVNREAYRHPVKVSPELFEVLSISQGYSRLSGGAFDITVGPLVDLWHKAGEANVMPDENAIAEAKAKVGFEKLILDANEQTVKFAVEGMRLDLGAIGKGYAVDKAVEAMQRRGALGGMVDSGGNIRCFGRPADRDDWLIGLQDPNAASNEASSILEAVQSLMTLKLKDMSIATSGDYRRFETIGGKKVSHIIDTNTATGAAKLSSDTIIAPSATDADALSTAVNVLGAEKGLALVESLEGVEAILITDAPEYRIIKSKGADVYISR
jgi:thiamine biosynthesis lipoprotein